MSKETSRPEGKPGRDDSPSSNATLVEKNPLCPGCGSALWSEDHPTGCPHLDDIDALCKADAWWFDNHPGTDYYWRPPRPSELNELVAIRGLSGELVESKGRVRVRLVEPGHRIRSYDKLRLMVAI